MDVDDLARRWWADGYGAEPVYGEISRIFDEHPDHVPALLRALVEAVPAGESIAYLGTTILEDRVDELPAATIAGMLRDSGLTRAQLDEVLSGMWAELRAPIAKLL